MSSAYLVPRVPHKSSARSSTARSATHRSALHPVARCCSAPRFSRRHPLNARRSTPSSCAKPHVTTQTLSA
eukprot:3645895-Rhodomonas_salina.5